MNGYECGVCDCAPCVCLERIKKQRIKDGKDALDIGVDFLIKLPRWKMSVIKWLCPGIMKFVKALFEYCMNSGEGDVKDYTKEMGIGWGIKE